MGLISLVDEIQFMLISSRHFSNRYIRIAIYGPLDHTSRTTVVCIHYRSNRNRLWETSHLAMKCSLSDLASQVHGMHNALKRIHSSWIPNTLTRDHLPDSPYCTNPLVQKYPTGEVCLWFLLDLEGLYKHYIFCSRNQWSMAITMLQACLQQLSFQPSSALSSTIGWVYLLCSFCG